MGGAPPTLGKDEVVYAPGAKHNEDGKNP